MSKVESTKIVEVFDFHHCVAGHASLIRTIIGGVQIIDMMILVIDVTKGEAQGLGNNICSVVNKLAFNFLCLRFC